MLPMKSYDTQNLEKFFFRFILLLSLSVNKCQHVPSARLRALLDAFRLVFTMI